MLPKRTRCRPEVSFDLVELSSSDEIAAASQPMVLETCLARTLVARCTGHSFVFLKLDQLFILLVPFVAETTTVRNNSQTNPIMSKSSFRSSRIVLVVLNKLR